MHRSGRSNQFTNLPLGTASCLWTLGFGSLMKIGSEIALEALKQKFASGLVATLKTERGLR